MVGGLSGKKRSSSTWMRDIKFPKERISTLLLFHPDVYLQQPLLHILTNHCFCSPVRREIILCIQLKLEINLYFREQKSKQEVKLWPQARTTFCFGFRVPFGLIACISKTVCICSKYKVNLCQMHFKLFISLSKTVVVAKALIVPQMCTN